MLSIHPRYALSCRSTAEHDWIVDIDTDSQEGGNSGATVALALKLKLHTFTFRSAVPDGRLQSWGCRRVRMGRGTMVRPLRTPSTRSSCAPFITTAASAMRVRPLPPNVSSPAAAPPQRPPPITHPPHFTAATSQQPSHHMLA